MGEKAQRAMIDAARLADELRAEQDMAQCLEREKKLLEAQVKDMQARVDEAQTNALKGGKKAMSRMKTGRTMSACRHSLISSKERSSPTKSRLKKLRKLPPSIWQSTDRP